MDNLNILANLKIQNDNFNDSKTLTESKFQTKEWRKKSTWYIDGKRNECEKYQIINIEIITGMNCVKTYNRFNISNNSLVYLKHPLKEIDGYDYTENFDYYCVKDNNLIYFNLKMICESGGAQTRSLREVYHFVKCQLEYLTFIKKQTQQTQQQTTYFVNILNGAESHKHIDKFNYLLNKYEKIKKYVYIGDLHTFKNWWVNL
jgi:hypothetical protein